MPISYRITSIIESDRYVSVFGQIVFSGNYTTGGDSLLNVAGQVAPEALPPGTPANTGGLFVFTGGQTEVHVTRAPLEYNLQLDIGTGSTAGVQGALIPGNGAFNFKIKLSNSSSGAELTNATAYSAQAPRLDNTNNHTLNIRYKKNI